MLQPHKFPLAHWLYPCAEPQHHDPRCGIAASLMEAYITVWQRIVNENFTFLLYLAFSIPCGFLYEHVEIFMVLGNL
jgi:hypothetical protein